MSFKNDLDITRLVNELGINPLAFRIPVTDALGKALIDKQEELSAPSAPPSSIYLKLKNKNVSISNLTINVSEFLANFKPKHTDFIYQYFAIKNDSLTILFRLNNHGNYFIANDQQFTSILHKDAMSYIGAYADVVSENTVGYTKYLWSEYTSETCSFFKSLPDGTVWEIHFGYVNKSIINTPDIELTEYEKEYLNTYHDHLTAVSKIKVPNGTIFYRDADIICPPRCGVV